MSAGPGEVHASPFFPVESVMCDHIDEIFGLDGLLAQRFDAYAPREGQIALARQVDQALADGGHLLAEGPTGTGKSIAYCVPSIRQAVLDEKKIGIVTANIALQEQLVTKDLPLLQGILPWDFTFAILKGRNNYFCHDRYYEELARGRLDFGFDADDGEMADAIRQWSQTTESGDVSELPFVPPAQVWRKFSVTSEDCKGDGCKFRKECFFERARQEAFQADILVTNYHLFFANLQLRETTGMDLVLPTFDAVIMDEAHKAADIARDFFGFRVTAGSVRWATRKLEETGDYDLRNAIQDESQTFFDQLLALRRSPSYRVRLREPDFASGDRLQSLLADASKAYLLRAEKCDEADEKAAFRILARQCRVLAERIEQAVSLSDSEAVYFIEENNGRAALVCKPITVADRLRTALFDGYPSVVLTSATLSVGGRFEHIRRELGLDAATEFVARSPFDFKRQALLVVPDGMPQPTDHAFSDAVADAVAQVVELAEGRTLGLFTSYRNLRLARERLDGCPYPVACQGDAPRAALTQTFREDTRSVLLGTESFWTGVDVPGEALSCVIIDRLPFPTPDDPVLDAISERDRNWFSTYSLPRAVIAFKQGFGRLIRATGDRGVVVLLDHRIITKSYGRLFVDSLPDVLKSRDIRHVRLFLREAA